MKLLLLNIFLILLNFYSFFYTNTFQDYLLNSFTKMTIKFPAAIYRHIFSKLINAFSSPRVKALLLNAAPTTPDCLNSFFSFIDYLIHIIYINYIHHIFLFHLESYFLFLNHVELLEV